MGPHFFKCGNMANKADEKQNRWHFNGAALFQVRKSSHVSSPHAIRFRHFNGAALFQVRKLMSWKVASGSRQALQWGRTFSSAEMQRTQLNPQRVLPLQWGRTFSSAEIRNLPANPTQKKTTSMGPHFFKCGNGRNTGN